MVKGFEIVFFWLFVIKMGVDIYVMSSVRKWFVFVVGNVLFCFGVMVLFGYIEIDYVDDIGSFGVWFVDEEVIGFDIMVD